MVVLLNNKRPDLNILFEKFKEFVKQILKIAKKRKRVPSIFNN